MADLDLSGLKRSGQEGGRWINHRPTGDEVAAWFTENVFIHEGLNAADYVSGVTMIQAVEGGKEVAGVDQEGNPVLVDVKNVAYVPYMRVDTRVRYWHDLLAKHEDWIGRIEPVPRTPLDTDGYHNIHLPPGFFRQPVRLGDGKIANFVACSMRCRIYKRDGYEERVVHSPGGGREVVIHGDLVLDAPAGTKAVNLLNKWGEDENALMKAETGAIGRALGMAGILVLGGGIATAEDVQESRASEFTSAGASGSEVALPSHVDAPMDDAALRERLTALVEQLRIEDPTKLQQFHDWVKERGFPSSDKCNTAQLRGAITKLERGMGEGG